MQILNHETHLDIKDLRKEILAYGLKVCNNAQDAEDVAQEVLLKIMQNASKLDFEASKQLRVWLYKVARNACWMYRRKTKKELFNSLNAIESHVPPPGTLLVELQEVLKKLPPENRAVLILRKFLGYSTKQTAKRLNISEELVRVRLSRAQKHLKPLVNP